jgi:hypothetical protein
MLAQEEGGKGANPPAEPQLNRPAPGNPAPQRAPGGGIFMRLRELPPAEQQRIMATDPQFLHLPPERQELIRARLRHWNSFTPVQKEKVRQREEILQGLSPAQRQEAHLILPQWLDLTPPRRQAVMEAFRHLRDLPADQRQSYLQSQEVRERFSPHERDILNGLNRLLPSPHPADPPESDQ